MTDSDSFFTVKAELDAILADANRPVDAKYRFYRCQCHPKCPDLIGWYLEVRPDDPETVMKVHKGVTGLYFFKFGMDPHIQKDEDRRALYNPIRLAALWLQSVEHYLLRGETLLVNSNGGMMPLDGVKILETVQSDKIDWDMRFDDEIVTICRWPEGRHWYLCSSKHRIFVPDKYDSYEEAHKVALRYVPADRLCVKENSGPLPPE